ncbi:MAG TPA: MarC family protein [Longimicrobiales bacterium]|nr:MarC family protein [Longimicrobiales bacterium]
MHREGPRVNLQFAILAFTSLLAIVNPLGAIPLFVALTAQYPRDQRRATLRRAIITGFGVLFVFALAGTYILEFFGITRQAFQVAGGILFFAVGWDMLQARRSRVKTTEEEESESTHREDVGIIPLGLPTLAGPGAITTVIALNGQAQSVLDSASVYVAIVLVLAICWITLAAAPMLTRRMGQTGMNVMTRLMGLLVMVIGAQFVINGATTVVLDIIGRARVPL